MHCVIYTSGDYAVAKATKTLGDKLKGGALQSGFTRRTLMRKHWHGLTRGEEIDAALGYLLDANWLR